MPLDQGRIERRRHPRFEPGGSIAIAMPAVVDAEVLDLSASGALLSTSASLAPGQRIQLRLLLAGRPFAAWAEVTRVEPGTRDADRTVRAGTAFRAVDERSGDTLRQFLTTEKRQG